MRRVLGICNAGSRIVPMARGYARAGHSKGACRAMTDKMFDLTGKTCVVTGASRGIGAATAHLLARFGAHVIVTSRKLESCEGVVEAIREQGGVASAIAAHVGEIASLDRLF